MNFREAETLRTLRMHNSSEQPMKHVAPLAASIPLAGAARSSPQQCARLVAVRSLGIAIVLCAASLFAAPFQPNVPQTWDDAALAETELPLAKPVKRQHVPSEYYYRIPVRPIYKTYPVYHPDKEPAGYFDQLRRAQPQLLWDDKGTRPKLETREDWVRAGELVFDAGIIFTTNTMLGPSAGPALLVRDRAWHEQTAAPVTPEGILPFVRYVIREQGKVEIGTLSCAMCHTRVMPDGTTIRGAQGNFPFARAFAFELRHPTIIPPAYRGMIHGLYTVPWASPNRQLELDRLPLPQLAAHFDAIPAGVNPRHGTGPWSPVQVPDLIGIQDRRYLDRTALQRHRGPADLMRYAALNQGMDQLTFFDGALASGQPERQLAETFFEQRYSDEQLYALALYLYSLKPPPNPHLPRTEQQKALVERGRTIFMDRENRCSSCHDPKQGYTNNKLVAAPGFSVPDDHPERAHILNQRVDTDPLLTLSTRRGTGLYKVPSLLGVWYRGPFEHNGSVATLEDWFDPRRLRDDYVPTGWKGPPGTSTRAVRGHEYGLDLSPEDRSALIAFLKTL
jgi:hypothetical protein